MKNCLSKCLLRTAAKNSVFRGFLCVISLFVFFDAAAAERFALDMGQEKVAYYFAEHDIMKGDSTLEYAVIFIHGAGGGAKDAARRTRAKLKQYKPDSRVYCIAPSFLTQKNCPAVIRKDALMWARGWRWGDPAENCSKAGSFDVIDRIYTTFSNPQLFPAMKRIVLCGFSAGGQFVNRYVAVGKLPVNPKIDTVFISGAGSSYLYVDDLRFVDGKFQKVKADNGFNNWYLGLDNRNDYCKDLSKEEIMKNLSTRQTYYFCGTADHGKYPFPMQGKDRLDRFEIYQKYVARFPSWKKATRFITVPDIAHDTLVFFHENITQKLVYGEISKK